MTREIILASGSEIRASLLRNAGLSFRVERPRVDEEAIRRALNEQQVTPRDTADALAEAKAIKVSGKHPDALVIGADQILDFEGRLVSKSGSPEEARTLLWNLRAKQHKLYSAVVIAQGGQPIWRHIGQVRLTMRAFSDAYLQSYLERNWDSVQHAVGGYKLEEEGVRLFSGIDGDYFNVLGLPLIELLGFLTIRGDIEQ